MYSSLNMKFVRTILFICYYIFVATLGPSAFGQQNSDAYSDWQEAENQASRAHDAEEKARHEKDKWRLGDDASEAYYAAKIARRASDKIYQASQKGDPTAKQYADRARAAADRARADSDQARYYADLNN